MKKLIEKWEQRIESQKTAYDNTFIYTEKERLVNAKAVQMLNEILEDFKKISNQLK